MMIWPFENDTNKITRKLSNARLENNQLRNHLIGAMIFLAAVILAFISSYAYNITNQYASSTAYQGIFQNLSQENISLLKTDSRIAQMGIYQSIGMTDKENGISMGIVCSDETTMQLSKITLTDGHMPQMSDELLIEKGYLDALDLDTNLGSRISIQYRNQASRQLETKDFRIAGFIQTTAENDRNRTAYNAIVSQDFVRENPALSTQPVSAMIAVRDAAKYKNQELKELIQSIGLHCSISADNIQANSLYIGSNNLSMETVLTVLIVGIALISALSLVVYNIFFISIMNHVKSFGQLRTIGATKKQIGQIVTREGNDLALRFIPPGCILGGILSFLIDRSAFHLISDLVLVILSGIIVFVCVKLSIRKPAKIATAVSPIEAFRYSSYMSAAKFKKSRKRLTPLSLASMNLSRSRKKSILTFLSLVLSGMMFVGISSLLSSLDPVQRARQSFPYGGVYIVELNRALVTPVFSLTDLQQNNPLTDELKKDILSIEGIDGAICQQEILATIDGMNTAIRSMNAEDYENIKDKVIDGTLPNAKEVGTNSLIVNMGSPESNYLPGSYEVGDTVDFSTFSYHVSAVIFDPNRADSFLLPAGEMEQAVPYNANSAFVIQSGTGDYAELEHKLQSIVSTNDALRLKTLDDMIMQYKSVFSTISISVYALLAIIFIFSIINLVNTNITNIISRQKEIGLFRAVGLDSTQLYQMIGFENAFQTLGSFAVSVVCGLLIGRIICSTVENIPGFSYIEYAFPAAPVFFYFLLIFILQFILTRCAVLYCKRSSTALQLRVTE